MDRENKKAKTYDAKKTSKLLLIVSSILLAGTIGLVVHNVVVKRDRDSYMQEIENDYELSFYELIQSINDAESKLGKLTVSTGRKNQETLLNEINKLAAVSIGHLSHLIQKDGGDLKIVRFINQLGDYADYLYGKTVNGEALSNGDKDKLGEIQTMVQRLGQELSSVQNKMDEGYRLINGYSGKDAFLADIFDGLNETTVEYPKMIYDGPFSDDAEKKTAKGLDGEDVSEEDARGIITGIFGGKGIGGIDFLNESGGVIPAYNFLMRGDGGQEIYIAVTKRGGRILNMDNFRSVEGGGLSEEECIDAASAFAALIGFSDMKNVWVSDYDGVLYVNFAYEEGGVIYYPDMIKVKVASDNGEILGVETANYFLNHTERALKPVGIDAHTAGEAVSDKLVIEYVRLALIPKKGAEVLCYEFYCGYDGADYFVYVDAESGEETDILRVIDSGSGRLLY
ncbi:MAG: germination protein YpeB [Clostridiales bacterium]|jgi:germination protein YpeB|nr:germination protein YpeB [Clostridiales bacterium]